MHRDSGRVSVLGAVLLLAVAALVASLAGGLAVGIEAWRSGAGAHAAMRAVSADLVVLGLAQLAGMLVATGAGVLAAFGSEARFRDALDIRPAPIAVTVLALTAGFALQFPLRELVNAVGELHPVLGLPEEPQRQLARFARIVTWGDAILVPLVLVAVPAVSEELFFRGLVLPGLARRYDARIGLAVSSALFGLVHVAPAAILYAAVAGVALGFVRLRTGSVLPPIAMHGAFNAAPVLLPAHVVRIEGFNTVGPGVYHLPAPLWTGGALLAGICIVMIARLTDDTHEP